MKAPVKLPFQLAAVEDDEPEGPTPLEIIAAAHAEGSRGNVGEVVAARILSDLNAAGYAITPKQ